MTRLSFVLRREWLSLIFAGVLVMLILSALLGNLGPRDLVALQSHRAALEARRDQLAAENAASGRKRRERDALERGFKQFQFRMGKRNWKREDLYARS